MTSSSLSSVVSSLVRAQMGSSLPGTVTDEDLDRCIGEIILREAKAKAERYKKEGIRAYLPKTDPNAPKANKRFLSSIIRSTDDHNKAILRAQAIAAAEIREEREEQERRERRARAEEATRDRKRKLRRRGESVDRWRPDPDRGRDRGRRPKRDWTKEHWDHSVSRSRSRSPKRKRYWDEDEEEYEERTRSSRRRSPVEDRRRKRRHRHDDSRSQSSSRSSGPSQAPSHRRDKGKGKADEALRNRDKDEHSIHSHHRHRSGSPLNSHRKKQRRERSISASSYSLSENDSKRRHKTHTPSRPPSDFFFDEPASRDFNPSNSMNEAGEGTTPGPSPPSPEPPMASKMDKYFDPSYDPRLDVAPLASKNGLTVDVPATGLIDNAQFEGWDTMLELIRQRREDKMEKKRLERLGLLPEKTKDGRGKKGKGMVSGISEESKGIMDIEYTKRGAVREWDMGKESI